MPQRNGQNPIKSGKAFGQSDNISNNAPNAPLRSAGSALCPACKTEVPPKPGFRFSSLKCPKCGAALAKK